MLCLALGLGSAGCGKSGVAGEIARFTDAGHSVAAFATTDASALGAKECQAGTVDRISVLVCEYASSDTAGASQPAAERWAGETGTGVVLRRGKVLMGLADRNNADPTGKTISALTKLFRRAKGT